jgi:sterol 14-demethylase
MVAPGAAQRLPEVFADPERFDPGRWLQPDGSDRVKPYTLITFGGGKHVCIGMHFAYLQVKLIWTLLLSRFAFAPDAPLPRPDYGSWVTGPRPPARVRYRRRPSPVAPSC